MRRGLPGLLGRTVLLAVVVSTAGAGETAQPSTAELAAITERGRLLYEYDQAVWHATDTVQMANPKTVEGRRCLARKENGKWTVVFGALIEDRRRFEIVYEADEQATLRQFAVKPPQERRDDGFFLHAARAVEAAMKDFGETPRPYNAAVLPAPAEQLLVYLYPAQTDARVYPLGGDVRYLVTAEGTEILEKRQMHKTVIEVARQPGKKAAAGFHTHVLSDLPEDTDVFHVLTEDPPLPEMVGTAHFLYRVKADGTIEIEKTKKPKK